MTSPDRAGWMRAPRRFVRQSVRYVVRAAALGLLLLPGAVPTTTAVARADEISDTCADPTPAASQLRPDDDGRPSAFDEFIQPLVAAAHDRRARLAADPDYQHRVNADLNSNRLNTVLLGINEENGYTYADAAVSVTILSLNVDTWDLGTISLSRDVRVPEIEDPKLGPGRRPASLAQVYKLRGWEGIRSVLEDGTGLSMDFQILMKDVMLRNYVQNVSGPVKLIVPADVHSNVYRLDGVNHPRDFIPAGLQELNTDHAMTFVLGESVMPRGYIDERHNRKNIMMKVLSCQLKMKLAARDVPFLLKFTSFMLGELRSQNLTTDFDFQMFLSGLGRVTQSFVLNGASIDPTFPQLGAARNLALADPDFGDGGLRRVHRIRDIPDGRDHPLVKQEVAQRAVPDWFMITIGGNPYSPDLVSDYWASTRELVASFLQQN